LFFKSLAGLSYLNYNKGDTKRVFEGAKLLLDYGERNSNSRSKLMGHWMNAFGHYMTGDIESSQKSCEMAAEVALDPVYPLFPKVTLGMAYFLGGHFQEAEDVLRSLVSFSEKYTFGEALVPTCLFLAPTLIAKGHMKQGLRMLEEAQQTAIKNQRRVWYALSEYILGKVYSQIALGIEMRRAQR
ncbi:MAG: hypothetical protein ACE5I0_10235, partial [Candidatus Binatia bacterium]